MALDLLDTFLSREKYHRKFLPKPKTFVQKVDSYTKRAGETPTRPCKFNRFYPANKTFGKDTTNYLFCQ